MNSPVPHGRAGLAPVRVPTLVLVAPVLPTARTIHPAPLVVSRAEVGANQVLKSASVTGGA